MDTDLLPCPFCGGAAYYTCEAESGSCMCFVGCGACGIAFKAQKQQFGPDEKLTKDIISAWNKRANANQGVIGMVTK